MRAITEEYERQLWDELNSLLTDVVPDGATEDGAERAIMGHDSDIHALHKTIQSLARSRAGYLRERLDEENSVTRARRRLYGKWA